jgi:hypothetical protein
MSIKNYKKGLRPIEDQAIENGRGLFEKVRLPKGKTSWLNPWWARRRHPGWAAYHATQHK